MENLTAAQKKVIAKIEKKGFKKDTTMSGFDRDLDGSSYYTFYAQHGMGAEMIQTNGERTGTLLLNK
jgi:hypothetical protein